MGRMQEVEIVLPDWVFNSIEAQEVLTLHRDYYRLRKPLERRLYEIARKHCGYQKEWKISLELLKKKCASASRLKEFKRLILKIVKMDKENNHMPDYAVRFEESKERNKSDMVIFINRGNNPPAPLPFHTKASAPPLNQDTYERARAVAPGYDVYELENQWREWSSMLPEPPRKPDEAFIGFCKTIYSKRGPV